MIVTTADILINEFAFTHDEAQKFIELGEDFGLTLDDFLFGAVYKETRYNITEQQWIEADLLALMKRTFEGKSPVGEKVYVATAGAPGSGKSRFIEHLIDKGSFPANAVYLDPDRVALVNMNAYKQHAESFSPEEAYATYRDGSNFINNFMMVWALYYGYSIVHGTTSTNAAKVPKLFQELSAAGYKTNLKVVFADAESRKAAIENRNASGLVQVTASDAVGKVSPVFERFADSYLQLADHIDVYYNSPGYWGDDNLVANSKAQLIAVGDKVAEACQMQLLPNSQEYLAMILQDAAAFLTPEQMEITKELFNSWPVLESVEEEIQLDASKPVFSL